MLLSVNDVCKHPPVGRAQEESCNDFCIVCFVYCVFFNCSARSNGRTTRYASRPGKNIYIFAGTAKCNASLCICLLASHVREKRHVLVPENVAKCILSVAVTSHVHPSLFDVEISIKEPG